MTNNEIKKDELQETTAYKDFCKIHDYLTSNKYISQRDRAVDFYYGNQWGSVTENTKNVPRPVFNICKLQINNKQSNIVSVPVAIKFFTNNSAQEGDTRLVTSFAKYLFKEMKHDRFRSKATWDGLVKGTAVQHLYYDQYSYGTFGDYVGGLKEEIIDFTKVAVANPFNKDVQAQKWIIIRSLKSVSSIKKMLKNKSDKLALLEKELSEFQPKENPVQEAENINVYLKYYRVDGEVYHSLYTKNVTLYEHKPLNPNLVKLKKEKTKEDEEWVLLPDDELTNNDVNEYQEIKFYRYPVHFLTFNESDESIYGKSELNDVIATQKYMNQLWSMQLLNVMNMAWDKYVVLPNALQNQVIDDRSGQVLVDYSKTGNGIKRLGGMNAMSNGVVELSAQAFNLHRSVHQITDLYTGQTEQKDIAASALAQLNSQADKPIDELRKKLWDFEEEIGKTMDLFIKLYFSKQKFNRELSQAELIKQGQNANRIVQEEFDGEQFRNVKFHIVAEAVQGTKNSELVQENLAQSLFLNGTWANMTTHDKEAYIQMSPLAQPLKEQLQALIEKQKADEIAMYQSTIEQLKQQNTMAINQVKRDKQYIDYLTSLNKSMEKSYKDEVKAHQDDVKARDEAVNEILTREPDGSKLKKQK